MKNRLIRLLLAALCLVLVAFAAVAEEELPAAPVFSLDSGFYASLVQLEITTDTGWDIYYTIDGSIPDESDVPYYDSIPLVDLNLSPRPNELAALDDVFYNGYLPEEDVAKVHVIRAVAISPEGQRSQVASGTFLVGYQPTDFVNVPIVSLMVEPDDFFDYDTGIYTLGVGYDDWLDAWYEENDEDFEDWQVQGNYSNRGREWERPVTVTFIDGGEGFTQDMGVRIKGGVSRSYNQRSLRLIAREDYGKKSVKYPIFVNNQRLDGTGEVSKYKMFVLRNGGNDHEFSKIRDPLFHRLATGMRMTTLSTRPVVVFINGEYWGLYTLTEENSDNFIENNYGIDNNNVITVKNGEVEDGEDEDIALYEEMYYYITENDMADEECYRQATMLLDVGSFADYCALQMYIYNEDGILDNNNWQMWRVRTPGADESELADGRWRMMLFDTDYSSGVYVAGENFAYNNLVETISPEEEKEFPNPTALLISLLKSPEFRAELIISLCDVRNVYFQRERAQHAISDIRPPYEQLSPDTFKRFGPEWIVQWALPDHLTGKISELTRFLNGRYGQFPRLIKETFGLSEPNTVTITTADPTLGTVKVNHSTLDLTAPFEGAYFAEYPITITAEPAAGAFVGWEITGATAEDPTAASTRLTITDKQVTVKAIFE